MAIKHPQHIVAFDKQKFGNLRQGFNHMMIQDLVQRAQASLILGRREELEQDDRYGQMLPYIVLYQMIEGKPRLFTYQRCKGIGENRLLGNLSVGLGGHVDLHDVQDRNSIVDILGTINNAMSREIEEEVVFMGPRGNEVKPKMMPVFFGVINDLRDAVGAVHYGLLYGIKIEADIHVQTREQELKTIGFLNETTLTQPRGIIGLDDDVKYEGWSQLVIEQIAEFEELGNLI